MTNSSEPGLDDGGHSVRSRAAEQSVKLDVTDNISQEENSVRPSEEIR